MIVLDTNVISELMRPDGSTQVTEWARGLDLASVTLTAVTVAELFYGLERLAEGRRRAELAADIAEYLDRDLRSRILPFDSGAGETTGWLMAMRERAGRPMDLADAQIAAICLNRDALLATRNTKDFEGTGVELINPWAA